jgi:Tfp pilus assembly protein PilN
MRLNINLASQKYEDVQQFYRRWGIAIGFTAVLTLLLIILVLVNYSSTSKSNAHIKELQNDIASLQKERADAEAVSNRPENHDVNEEKNYWNRQINRRQLSWTQLFNDLQRIMPARAYLSSVHPEITQDNRLRLTLIIKGDTHENGLELVQKMEKSERFRGTQIPQINSEQVEKNEKTGAQLYKFDIVTYYTAALPVQNHPSNKDGL